MLVPLHAPARWSAKAIGVPAASAGTLYLLALALAAQQCAPADSIPIGYPSVELLGIVGLVGLASAVGAVVSALPLLIGVFVMSALGRWNLGLRHPAIWALAGAAMAALLVLGGDIATPPALALLCTGAVCAALARGYVHWPEDQE